MIIPNIEQVLTKNREKTLVMFIMKNTEGKYLVTSNNYFNYLSLPCKLISGLTIEENQESLNNFLLKEFDFVGTLNSYVENIRVVANISGDYETCNLICFELKDDSDLRLAVEREIQPNPTEEYQTRKFLSEEELKSEFWNKRIDPHSYYFIVRSKETVDIALPEGIPEFTP